MFKFEKKNHEINQGAKKVTEGLKKLKEDFSLLIDINNSFSKENEELKRRIHKSNESDSDEFEQKGGNKKRNKGEHISDDNKSNKSDDTMKIDQEELTEKEENKARVC